MAKFEVSHIYDRWVAHRFDQDPFDIYGQSREAALRHIDEAVRPVPRKVLDIGMGTGTLLSALHRRFPFAGLSGMEVSAKMTEVAKAKFTEQGVRGVGILPTGAEQLKSCFAPGELDLVTMHYVLSYLDTPRTLRDIRDVLAPGGFLSLSSTTSEALPLLHGLAKNFVSEDFIQEQLAVIPADLEALENEVREAGFEILKTEPFRKNLDFIDYDHLKDFILHSGWLAHPAFHELTDERDAVYREFTRELFPLQDCFVSGIVLVRRA
jgi:ubiquinone/menaquinone biosynthesis C-methylase UbiE